jgi:hypothetical protein
MFMLGKQAKEEASVKQVESKETLDSIPLNVFSEGIKI